MSLSEEPWFLALSRSTPVRSYLALEWIEGQTLESLFHERTLLGEHTLLARLFMQAASALAVVHAAGLVHRDVKPSNLMVADGALKLMDFGIARSQAEARTIVTSTGYVVGSPPYMSPEQLRALDAEAAVGPASDVYSLCATFYELFTGTRLFDHDRAVPGAVDTRKLAGDVPEGPRRRAPALPWEVEAILLGGLQPEAVDRYPSMAALESDLRRFLKDEPIEHRPPSLARRARLAVRRNPALFGSLGASSLIVAAVVAGWVGSILQEQGRTRAERDRVREHLARYRVNDGIEALDRGDRAAALALFASALAEDAPDSDREQAHRMRVGSLLSERGELVACLRVGDDDERPDEVRVSTDGRFLAVHLLTTSARMDGWDEGFELWEVATAARLRRIETGRGSAMVEFGFVTDPARFFVHAVEGSLQEEAKAITLELQSLREQQWRQGEVPVPTLSLAATNPGFDVTQDGRLLRVWRTRAPGVARRPVWSLCRGPAGELWAVEVDPAGRESMNSPVPAPDFPPPPIHGSLVRLDAYGEVAFVASRVLASLDGVLISRGVDNATANVARFNPAAGSFDPSERGEWPLSLSPGGRFRVETSDPGTARGLWTLTLNLVDMTSRRRHVLDESDRPLFRWTSDAAVGLALPQHMRGWGGGLRAWRTNDGAPLFEIGRQTNVEVADLSPDLRRAVLSANGGHGGLEGTFVVEIAKLPNEYDLTGAGVLHLDDEVATDVRFSADGARVVTAGANGGRIWDAGTGRPTSARFGSQLEAAWFEPSGRLVTRTSKGTLEIRRPTTGELLVSLDHPDGFSGVLFEGDRVVSAARSGLVRELRLVPDPRPLEELVQAVRAHAGRELDALGVVRRLSDDEVLEAWTKVRERVPVEPARHLLAPCMGRGE